MTTTTLSLSTNSLQFGTNVTLSAMVGLAAATGTVNFIEGSTTVASATLNSGAASASNSTFTVGSHTLTAVYGGSSTYAGSASSPVTLTVTAAPAATLALKSTARIVTLSSSAGLTWTSTNGS